MSEDEIVVTIAAVALGPVAWLVWFLRASAPRRLDLRPSRLWTIAITLLACTQILFLVLITAAADDVRGAPAYLFMYVVLGLVWLRLAEAFFAYFGVSARDDVVERNNSAATTAVAGALVGVTLCYAGGNIGDGPGWWAVVLSGALATFGLMIAWSVYEAVTSVSEAVTIDRDPAAGIRLGAFLIACGLLLGWGVAGNWQSAWLTFLDFVRVLPFVAILIGLAAITEPLARPTAEQPRAPIVVFGLGFATIYLAFAVMVIAFLELPE